MLELFKNMIPFMIAYAVLVRVLRYKHCGFTSSYAFHKDRYQTK